MSTNQEVFNQIAPSWYNYRHWSIFRTELEKLARRWQRGRLLNVGCGHGADFLPFIDNFELHGVDFSVEMLRLAGKYARKFSFSPNLVLGDISYLPYRDQAFDWAISVATYHHLDAEGRPRALVDLRRVLKPGGEAFITVWNRWQPRFWFHPRDVLVPWKTGDKSLQRYYYLFSYAELKKLAEGAGFHVLNSFPESSYRFPLKQFSRNICLLVKKP